MTIAICLKVGDGVVLGTDSAASLIGEHDQYYNIYYSAEKTINLVKGWPVGMMTYGLGGLMGMSISSHARDLRDRLEGNHPDFEDWKLDGDSYTIEQIADRVRAFFYDEFYRVEFDPPPSSDRRQPLGAAEPEGMPPRGDEEVLLPEPSQYPALGFMIAGFSAGQYYPEVWTVEVGEDGLCTGPALLHPLEHAGVLSWRGQPEALNRLLFGWSDEAVERLMAAGVPVEVIPDLLASYTDLAHPAMPMQDAIDLVRYLADVTVGFVRFKAGPPTVAPPIDIAAITRHQGFRWIARKHYFSPEFNRPAS